MGHQYSVEFENVTVTAAGTDQDFFMILPATQKPCRLLALYLDQSSEIGDAQEEFLRYKIIRGHTTVGSGGSAVTAQKLHPDAPTAGATCRVNDTTPASAGTPADLHSGTFNVRSGLIYIPTPEMQIVCKNAERLVVRMMSTVSDDVSMSGTLYFEEL
jgi:hypothetical protein